MILRPEPLKDAINSLSKPFKVIYASSGKAWNQESARQLAQSNEDLVFIVVGLVELIKGLSISTLIMNFL